MEETLQVQNQRNRNQENLETADSRVKYLVNQASYSTIHLVYYQYVNGATGNSGEPDFFTKLQQAFSNGGYIIRAGVLFAVTIWPLILAGFLGWFLIKKWKHVSVQSIKKI